MWKRTNFGIPNEINASSFRAAAILDHWVPACEERSKRRPHAIALPRRVPARVGRGRLDSGPTGGVFPARLEAGIAAPPHLKPDRRPAAVRFRSWKDN